MKRLIVAVTSCASVFTMMAYGAIPSQTDAWYDAGIKDYSAGEVPEAVAEMGAWAKAGGAEATVIKEGAADSYVNLHAPLGGSLTFTPAAPAKQSVAAVETEVTFRAYDVDDVPDADDGARAGFSLRAKAEGGFTFIGRDGGEWIDIANDAVPATEQVSIKLRMEICAADTSSTVRYIVNGNVMKDADGREWFSIGGAMTGEIGAAPIEYAGIGQINSLTADETDTERALAVVVGEKIAYFSANQIADALEALKADGAKLQLLTDVTFLLKKGDAFVVDTAKLVPTDFKLDFASPDGTFVRRTLDQATGLATVACHELVATVGADKYESLAAAVAAAQAGGVVTLEKDVAAAEFDPVAIDKDLTLNLNGKTIANTKEVADCKNSALYIAGMANVTISNGVIDSRGSRGAIWCTTLGEVALSDLTLYASDDGVKNGSCFRVENTGAGKGTFVLTNVKAFGETAGCFENGGGKMTLIDCEATQRGKDNYRSCAVATHATGITVVESGTYTAYSEKEGEYNQALIVWSSGGDMTVKPGVVGKGNIALSVDNVNAVDYLLTVEGGTFEGGLGVTHPETERPLVLKGGVYDCDPSEYVASGCRIKVGVPAEGQWQVLNGLAGSGTEDDPFVIADLDDLRFFRDGVRAGAFGQGGEFFKQTADIDLGGETWLGIGSDDHPFSANYDGDNHEVQNFVLAEEGYSGFFKSVWGIANPVVIKNLKIYNGSWVAGTSNKACSIGFGDVEGDTTIENVTVSGSLDGNFNTGAFTCWCEGNVKFLSCTNLATVTAHGSKVGGFHAFWGCAEGSLVMSNCCNRGTVTLAKNAKQAKADGVCAVGGLLGYAQQLAGLMMIDCVNEGKVVCTFDGGTTGTAMGGGLIGQVNSELPLSLVNCANTGDVVVDVANEANENALAGGLVGCVGGAIALDGVANSGAVSVAAAAGKTAYAGSLIGNANNKQVNASGVNTAQAGVRPIGTGAGKAAALTFATVAEGVATFVDAPVANAAYKVMLAVADAETPTLTLAQAGDWVAFDLGFGFDAPKVAAADGLEVSKTDEGAGVVKYTAVVSGPTVDPESGTIEKDATTGWYVVAPKAGATTVAIRNAGDAIICVPISLDSVSGVKAGNLRIRSAAGVTLPTEAFIGGTDTFSIELNPDAKVLVGDELVSVRPELSDAKDDVRPLTVGEKVAVGVKTIPGFHYALIRSEEPQMGISTAVDAQEATGARLELTDGTDRSASAFYRVRISKGAILLGKTTD